MKKLLAGLLSATFTLVLLLNPALTLADERIFDPKVNVKFNTPSNAKYTYVYTGERNIKSGDLHFDKIAPIKTYYGNNGKLICTKDQNLAVFNEDISYSDLTANIYLYDSSTETVSKLNISNIHMNYCDIKDSKLYFSGETMIGGYFTSQRYYLYDMSTNQIVKTLDTMTLSGNKYFYTYDVHVMPDGVYFIGDKLYFFDFDLNLKASYDDPNLKFVNGNGDGYFTMYDTNSKETLISSNLGLWSYKDGVFSNNYLNNSGMKSTSYGYITNKYNYISSDGNDYLVGAQGVWKYNGNGTFAQVELPLSTTQMQNLSVINGLDWFLIPLVKSSQDYAINLADKSVNTLSLDSELKTNRTIAAGFTSRDSFILSDGNIYVTYLGSKVKESYDIEFTATNGTKKVTAEFYNGLGQYIGSETKEYNLQGLADPGITGFYIGTLNTCSKKPTLSWEIENSSDITKLILALDGKEAELSKDTTSYEITKFPYPSSAELKYIASNGQTFVALSQSLNWNIPANLLEIVELNGKSLSDSILPSSSSNSQSPDSENAIKYLVDENIIKLNGSAYLDSVARLLFVKEGRYFDIDVKDNLWKWESPELPNGEYQVKLMGECVNQTSESIYTIVIDGDKEVEIDWEIVGTEVPQVTDHAPKSSSISSWMIYLALGTLLLILGTLIILWRVRKDKRKTKSA